MDRLALPYLIAWFSSTKAAQAQLGNKEQTLTVLKQAADDITLNVEVTLTTVTKPELSEGTEGKTYYKVGEGLYENTNATTIGVYEISVAWEHGDDDKAVWADSKNAVGTVNVSIAAASHTSGNIYAELLASNATDAKSPASALTHKCTVSIAADGALSLVAGTETSLVSSKIRGNFAVRPGIVDASDADTFTADENTTNEMSFTSLLTIS